MDLTPFSLSDLNLTILVDIYIYIYIYLFIYFFLLKDKKSWLLMTNFFTKSDHL